MTEAQSECLSAAFEIIDAACASKALATVTRTHRLTTAANGADVTRYGLYMTLPGNSDFRQLTLLGMMP